MAKALKTAALVVGAAALIATGVGAVVGAAAVTAAIGVSAATLSIAAGALSVGAKLLAKKPEVTASQEQRLVASIDPRAFRKTVLGQTAMATDIRYEEWSGADQEYLDWIICLASHAIDGVEEIWQDQEMLWSATTGVTAKYAGYFSVPNIVLEGSPANAFTFGSGKWNGSARLTGCAYLRLRFKTTGNSKKATSPFSSGVSTRLTIIGRGAKLYDPRRDSTVPGGSGPMRWNDQSTWRYTTDDGAVIGENLALQILRVVLGSRITNPVTGEKRLATGSGVPGRRLNLVDAQIAANLCDELVNRSAGGQEPRYHGAGVISEGDDPKTVLDMLCAACCGRFRDTGGKLSLVIAHNDLAAIAADDGLVDDDVVGPFTWDPDPALETAPNVVRGRYVDASSASLYQLIDYPEVRIASTDGQDRIFPLDLGVVESPSQAQRIARQVLQRKQYQRVFQAPFDIRAWKYTVGDVLPFTFAPLGFVRAVFRVVDQELGQGGTCVMTLSVEHQQIYAWDASDAAPVLAADPVIYNKGNNPLILAIDEAATTATAWVAPGATIGGTRDPVSGAITGGRTAQQALADVDVNTSGILEQALRQDDLVQVFDARTLVEGQPVGAKFLAFRNQVTDPNTGYALASDFKAIFAKASTGTAWNLNLDVVKVSPTKTLAQRFNEIGAVTDGATVSVKLLQDVFIGDGQSYAKAVLRADANGTFGAFSINADGVTRRSVITLVADEIFFISSNGGVSVSPFKVSGSGVVATNFTADVITYGALVQRFTDVGRQNLSPAGWYQELPGGLIMQGGRYRGSINTETTFAVTFPKPFPNQVLAVGAMPFLNSFSNVRDLWMQNVSEPSLTGTTFATQAATNNQQALDGFDWWAWGK